MSTKYPRPTGAIDEIYPFRHTQIHFFFLFGPQIPTFLMTSQDGILGVGVSIIGQKSEDSGPKNAGEECYQKEHYRSTEIHSTQARKV